MRFVIKLILTIILLFSSKFTYSDNIPAPSENAEIELLQVIDYMRNGQNEKALIVAAELSKNYPNYLCKEKIIIGSFPVLFFGFIFYDHISSNLRSIPCNIICIID